ncbi:MAG: hypothetical protein EAX86_01575 [Candidatus Heimdallarchaeota archaeon]|nr:hypothetical protein [Candidatus Heimdallarchaeota archaeon]
MQKAYIQRKLINNTETRNKIVSRYNKSISLIRIITLSNLNVYVKIAEAFKKIITLIEIVFIIGDKYLQ